MSAAFQVASLVNPPTFPNSIVWSEDNLIAVATGEIVTILNPERPHAPRGVITITVGKPFPIGVIDRAYLLSGCLLPTCLSRDRQPCVRSLSWSPVGFAPNNGCLLAVCSSEGRVKIYRQPYCEYQAEWIELMDVSDLLHGYFAKINYGEPEVTSLAVIDDSATQICRENDAAACEQDLFSRKESKRKRVVDLDSESPVAEKVDTADADSLSNINVGHAAAEIVVVPSSSMLEGSLVEVVVNSNGKEKEKKSPQMQSAAKARTNRSKKMPKNHNQHLITAHQYASRYSMLSAVAVAWSPMLKLSSTSADNSSEFYSLLAVGMKSGDISIWRIHRPPYYSIEHQDNPKPMILVGVVKAHNAWVTALSWGLLASGSSPRVLLASGCSDGSVKIWLACGNDLENSSEANEVPFSLFSEVVAGDNVLVSALSLLVPVQSPSKVLLAVGKGSGSFQIWTCNAKTKSSKKVGSYDAHLQAVSGLAWAFDGRCLYSCSLDNSMHGWIHHKGSLSVISIPPNNLGTRSFSDLPSVSDSCYGLAISPGNLALAVVRRFDAGQLDQMYQKRTQRAAVEFFWIGGQQFEISSTKNLDFDIEACPGFSRDELGFWGSKLLWSLSQFERHVKHLVIWDIIAASLAFKQCAPKFIEGIFLRWLELLFEGHLDLSTKNILSDVLMCMSNITSRRLCLLNVFIRRVMLPSSLKESKVCVKSPNLGESCTIEEERQWIDLILHVEEELRERLVGISLSTVLSRISQPAPKEEFGLWNPSATALMLKWVAQNHARVHPQLNSLASEVRRLATRLHAIDEYEEEEQCSFCSAVVPLESPETALCQGENCPNSETPQNHKLSRCAVSMKVCSLTYLWFCICCQRRASELPPHQLFTMPSYPCDFISFIKPVVNNLLPKPLCPFCGISLQRLQPDFLLSISPV